MRTVILELIPSFLFSDFMEDSRNAKEHERTLRNAKESFGQGSGAISYKKHIKTSSLPKLSQDIPEYLVIFV